MINVFQPTLGALELAAVASVFDSSWIGKGQRTSQFEEEFAAHLGVRPENITSVNSCTEALFVAMQLAGIGPGSEVVMPTVSFVGAGNAVAALGGRPVFCDVDERTLMPSVEDITAAMTPATKAVIVLHYGGYPGDIVRISQECRARGVLLVEDAACAVASRVGSKACGVIGDIGVWSFDGQKIVAAGDGGMLYARDPQLVARARKLTYFGLEQLSGFSQAKHVDTRWWEFEISSFSRRSIMNDVQAAIGSTQLQRLPEFIHRRREVVEHYDRELRDDPSVQTPPPLPLGHTSSYYLYWVQMEASIRDAVARDMYERGIYTTFRYAALHRVRAYKSPARLPKAESAVARTLCLPLHQALTDADVEFIVAALKNAIRGRWQKKSEAVNVVR
ncbi:DegT/DnrJ/EryC1/StrS family aminotransferase [Micromonospora sediminicola]|uniref:DegT/DnrJ/EryC1/StrS family aminotransferase n=1 Tax=Micromonospora sediminicola TaxID=946078 RepID=UPI0033DEBD90